MSDEARAQRRARRLVRLYPRGWRERFGEEFEQLLIDEMGERPHAPRRTADVAAHALLAHLTAAGLAGRELAPEVQAWRSLRVLGLVAVAFLAFAIGIWSQVSVGWSWASPTAPDTRVAMAVMSWALLGLCAVFVIAVAVILWLVGRSIRTAGRRPIGALGIVAACVAGLWAGCGRLAAQWPGTPAGHHSLVPAALARPAWAATLWLSAYWSHPRALGERPGGELPWMVVSAVLLAVIVVAGWLAVRCGAPSRRGLRVLAGLGVAGIVMATVFVAAATTWILGSAPGPSDTFQPGAVDDVSLVLLASALMAAVHAARRSLVVARAPAA